MSGINYSNIETSITLNFCDNIESNDNIGEESDYGFSNNDILRVHSQFSETSEIYNLKDMLPPSIQDIPDVFILIIRNNGNNILDQLLQILITSESNSDGIITGVQWDTEKYKNGQIKQSKEKYKLIFKDLYEEYKINSNYQLNKGTIYNYKRIPQLEYIKCFFESILYGPFVIEGNCYYNKKECYTSMHRDKKRKKVIGLKLGGSSPLNFRWYHGTIRCSETKTIILNHGDIYILSELATGSIKEKLTKLFIKYSEGSHANCLK